MTEQELKTRQGFFESDIERYITFWERRPGSLQHTIKNLPLPDADIKAACRVLDAIRAGAKEGAFTGDSYSWIGIDPAEMLELLHRRADNGRQ
jgi:hypothetical protein